MASVEMVPAALASYVGGVAASEWADQIAHLGSLPLAADNGIILTGHMIEAHAFMK